MKWLRKKLRAWLGITEPAPLVEDESNGIKIEPSLFQRLLQDAGERNVRPFKFQAPVLPKSVRGDFRYNKDDDPGALGEPSLAFDDAANAPTWAYLNQANCGLAFPGYGYLSELSQRTEYRAPVETTASEATREWIELTVKGKTKAERKEAKKEPGAEDAQPDGIDADGDGDVDGGLEDKIEQIEAALDEFKVRDLFRQISEVDGFFGRAQLSINMTNDTDEKRQLPLIVDKATIAKGSLKNFVVVEPIWTTPYNYNSTDPTRPDFYKPRAWFVIGKRVHASRLLTFISREVADILKPAYNFGGLSLSQLMDPSVFQWLRTRNSVSDLIHNFSVMCLKTDMAEVLQGTAGAGSGLLDRAKLFTQTRDNQGLTLLDKDREELAQVAVPLANLDKLQAQAQEHMAAPSHIPLVKLTGITPAGLNANSEGEIKVWYDWIRAYQLFFFAPHLKHVIDILQLHLFGEIDEAIGFTFVPLNSPTVKELSEIRKADAETDQIYITNGVVSPEESRERVASDPMSGYDNLSGPAPEPPAFNELDKTAELDEDGKQKDHKRSEESAEAAHERTMQQQAAEAKANKKPPKR
jgi:Uncharacterized protein conserved in bacteria